MDDHTNNVHIAMEHLFIHCRQNQHSRQSMNPENIKNVLKWFKTL